MKRVLDFKTSVYLFYTKLYRGRRIDDFQNFFIDVSKKTKVITQHVTNISHPITQTLHVGNSSFKTNYIQFKELHITSSTSCVFRFPILLPAKKKHLDFLSKDLKKFYVPKRPSLIT